MYTQFGACKIFTIILKEVYDLFSKDAFKGIVHTKMMILSLTHPHVIPNP